MKVLDDVQARDDIIDFILRFSAERGYSPTIREIGRELGIKSTSTCQKYVDELVCLGRLERDPRLSRTLRVIV